MEVFALIEQRRLNTVFGIGQRECHAVSADGSLPQLMGREYGLQGTEYKPINNSFC